jgi:hypothetical protein
MGSSDRFSISSASIGRILGIALAACLALAALGSAAAGAATVSKSGSTLTYNAANNETNQTIVSLSGTTYTFSDNGATVGVGSGCTSTGAHTATCAGAGITGITINSGNLNDLAWETAATPATVFGGDGNDTMIGGNGGDVLIGCLGNDTYNGGGGADTMVDGAFCSGGGTDTVDYSSRTQTVFVSLDGTADDGGFAEGDNVGADIENVTGGSGDDDITGSAAPNTIIGNAGDDGIDGGPGNDLLSGGNGDDMVTGGAGADTIDTGSGDNDVEAADGEIDQITCGSGFDTGTADPNDRFNPSCDALDTSGDSGDFGDSGDDGSDFGDDGDFTDQTAGGICSQVQIAQRPVTLHRGVVGIRLSLPLARGRACRGTLKLVDLAPSSRPKKGAATTKLGSASFSVRGNKSKRVKVQITPGGRRQIVHAGHLSALVKIVPKGKGSSKPAPALITINTP